MNIYRPTAAARYILGCLLSMSDHKYKEYKHSKRYYKYYFLILWHYTVTPAKFSDCSSNTPVRISEFTETVTYPIVKTIL